MEDHGKFILHEGPLRNSNATDNSAERSHNLENTTAKWWFEKVKDAKSDFMLWYAHFVVDLLKACSTSVGAKHLEV